MSGGARVSSGITGGLKKTILDIREIAGEHSDDEIYAMLKECCMDPNETIQRLLHLDTFHEVKKKHGRRREVVQIKQLDNPGQQHGARVGRGAKVGSGYFHSQNGSPYNGRRSLGGSKENGYTNISKGYKSENTTASQSSRSLHVKVGGEIVQGGQENVGTISYDGHDPLPDILISHETCVPAGGNKPSAFQLTAVGICAKQEKILSNGNHVESTTPGVQLQPASSMSSKSVHLDAVLSASNSVQEDHYAIPNGDATWSSGKIPNGSPISYMTKTVGGTAKSQLTDFNGNGHCQEIFAAKDVLFKEKNNRVEEHSTLEEDISVLNEEASTFNVSDGYVVFPEHLQVPEAYKGKLTFGSFGSSWALDGKQSGEGNAMNTDMPADDFCPVKTVTKSYIDSNEIISSTVKDAQESEDTNHLQSPPPMSKNTTPLFGHASSEVVIDIDGPETESVLRNGGPDLANHLSNYVFGYAPQSQLQAHDSAEPQGGDFIASPTSSMDQNSIIQPSGVTHDIPSSPPPAPLFRQTYHPDFFPYGHYYPQFFAPQVQQYLTHVGFPQQPSVANLYLAYGAAAAAGIKNPHQQQKQGLNAETDGYIGVPSGYSPYVPYALPYVLPPAVIPGVVAGDADHASQMKENTTRTTEQQIESSDDCMAGTASGLQVNPFYSLAPGQGYTMAFPPTRTGFGAFGGVYHPAVQTIPAPQPTLHPHI